MASTLHITFFEVRGTHYAKARSEGNVVELHVFNNLMWELPEYIRKVTSWGWNTDEITSSFGNLDSDTAAEITRAIEIYS